MPKYVSFSVCEGYAAENVTKTEDTTATPPESDAPPSNVTGPMGHGRILIVTFLFSRITIPGLPIMSYIIVILLFYAMFAVLNLCVSNKAKLSYRSSTKCVTTFPGLPYLDNILCKVRRELISGGIINQGCLFRLISTSQISNTIQSQKCSPRSSS